MNDMFYGRYAHRRRPVLILAVTALGIALLAGCRGGGGAGSSPSYMYWTANGGNSVRFSKASGIDPNSPQFQYASQRRPDRRK